MPRSRKLLQLAGIYSFNMQSWKATCLNSYAFRLFGTGEMLLTHMSLLELQCEQGSPSCGELGGWWRCEAPPLSLPWGAHRFKMQWSCVHQEM